MIVVIGALAARVVDDAVVAAGLAAAVAQAAVRAGSRVEVIARVGDDPDGDALLLALAGSGVGHVAVLRDPSRHTVASDAAAEDDAAPGSADVESGPTTSAPIPTLEAADVGLAMRYLTDLSVVALIHPPDVAVISTVREAVSWASAHLLVAVDPSASAPSVDELPAEAVVIEASSDAEGPGLIIGRYLAAIDGGMAPGEAFTILREVAAAPVDAG